jgi:hypothetical protein
LLALGGRQSDVRQIWSVLTRGCCGVRIAPDQVRRLRRRFPALHGPVSDVLRVVAVEERRSALLKIYRSKYVVVKLNRKISVFGQLRKIFLAFKCVNFRIFKQKVTVRFKQTKL